MGEVQSFLKMLGEVYGMLGLDYTMALSTRCDPAPCSVREACYRVIRDACFGMQQLACSGRGVCLRAAALHRRPI